jgi:hypothetical protein
MSDYKPRRITVTVVGDGFYIAHEADGASLYVPAPVSSDNITQLHRWAMDLDDTQLEAAVQMYWDRWMFQSGDECDKLSYKALDVERKRRLLPHSTWSPGIF